MMTLQQIRDQSPCTEGWTKLLKSLGNPSMDTVISLGDIAKSNGADDAWWCVMALDWNNEHVRRDVIKVLMLSVRRAAKHAADERVHQCIETIQDWLDGKPADLIAGADAADAAVDLAADAAAWAAWAAEGKACAVRISARAVAAVALAAVALAAAAEKESQRSDLIAAFPPLILK